MRELHIVRICRLDKKILIFCPPFSKKLFKIIKKTTSQEKQLFIGIL